MPYTILLQSAASNNLAEHLDSILWIAGMLFAGIVWFISNWMVRHDKFAEQAKEQLADHEKMLALSAQDRAELTKKFDAVLMKLDNHIEGEEAFWKENMAAHLETQYRLKRLEAPNA